MSPLDQLFFDRAFELAARGIGSTSPNPAVGSIVVRDGRVIGEGYHHRAGDPHAEANALTQAGDARGATVYVTLEPCNHIGRTPACSRALIEAGVARVVIGTRDPNPKTSGGGIDALREAGIAIELVDEPRAHQLIEPFAYAVTHDRPFVALKMAMSLDGRITSQPGVQEWITSEEERLYVRDLRIAYDAIMVGAGTVRVDDPQLTVRPPSHRLQPFKRIIACETDSVSEHSRVFAPIEGYATTIVLAPNGARERFANLRGVADVVFVGSADESQLNLRDAVIALRERGVQSVLCEGGPTLAARTIAARIVDRFYWAIAPVLLTAPAAVPVLAGADLATLRRRLRFDRMDQIGCDVVISGLFDV